jgi:hypothetical protein
MFWCWWMYVNFTKSYWYFIMWESLANLDKASVASSIGPAHHSTGIWVLKKHKANLMSSVGMYYFTSSWIKLNSLKWSSKNYYDVNKMLFCEWQGWVRDNSPSCKWKSSLMLSTLTGTHGKIRNSLSMMDIISPLHKNKHVTSVGQGMSGLRRTKLCFYH